MQVLGVSDGEDMSLNWERLITSPAWQRRHEAVTPDEGRQSSESPGSQCPEHCDPQGSYNISA